MLERRALIIAAIGNLVSGDEGVEFSRVCSEQFYAIRARHADHCCCWPVDGDVAKFALGIRPERSQGRGARAPCQVTDTDSDSDTSDRA